MHVRELVQSMTDFYAAIDAYGMWLDADQAQQVHGYIMLAGVHHQRLAYDAMQAKRKLWYVTEKAHYFQHVGITILATRWNPRFSWRYLDEDYMGRCSQVAKNCMRARGPLKMGDAFVLRWRPRMLALYKQRAT